MKVYWRRLAGFPALKMHNVEVVTESELPVPPELGAGDNDWNEVEVGEDHAEVDIDEALGLCGTVHDPVLIADAIIISASLHKHLGLTPRPWDYKCLWRQVDFDSHRPDDAEQYFRAMGVVYGAEVEAMARRRYAE